MRPLEDRARAVAVPFPVPLVDGRVRDAYEAAQARANVTDFDGLLTGLRTCSRRTPALRAPPRPVPPSSSSTSTRTPRGSRGDRLASRGGGGAPRRRGRSGGRGLMVVGTTRSRSLSGATVANMLDFPARYPGCGRDARAQLPLDAAGARARQPVLARNRDQFHKIARGRAGRGAAPGVHSGA